MRMRVLTIGAFLVLWAATSIVAQNGTDLFQQALVRQTANGDVHGAIQIYERIVRDFSSDRALIARTLVQLGKCYESLGQARSREYFEQAVNQYADQADVIAEARSRLAAAAKGNTPLQIATPPTDDPSAFAISPDGGRIVFAVTQAGRGQLWLRHLDTGRAAPIAGADLVLDQDLGATFVGSADTVPFWSPDGKSIGFFSGRKLKQIGVNGGTAQVLADAPAPAGGTWSRDGVIVFASTGIQRVAADGSRPAEPLYGGKLPQFLPDGRRFLFYRQTPASLAQAAQSLWVGSLDDPSPKLLPILALSGAFAAPDQLLYTTDAGLFAQRLDLKTLETVGPPSRVVEGGVLVPALGFAALSVSPTGALAYRASVAPQERQFVWFDRNGRQIRALSVPDAATPCCARISPDARTVVFGRNGGGAPAGSLWTIQDIAGAESRRLAAGGKTSVWSPDGEQLAVGALAPARVVSLAIFTLSNNNFRYLRESVFERPTDWSRDGQFLLYESERNAGRHLMVLPLRGGEPIPIAQTPAAEEKGRFSPDGRWIAYQSDELRERNEVFVQAFPGSRESRRQVSVAGGTSPVWRGDGREIYFMSPDFHLMVAAVTFSENAQTMQLGTPVPFFPAAFPVGSEFEVSNDGQRFLINRPVGSADAAPITVLSNWTRAK